MEEVKISEEVKIKDQEEVDDNTSEGEEDTSQSPSSGEEDSEETKEESKEENSKETDEESNVPASDVHIKEVEGETPREKALRLELTRQRLRNRQMRVKGLFGEEAPEPKKEVDPKNKDVLKKYDPSEIENLKEVLEVMADDLGFIKKSEYAKESYQKDAHRELNSFLEKHPEYLPENDTDNTLWNAFQGEFNLYNRPQEPRDYQKIFNKIHHSLFGIKSEADYKRVDAQRQKAKVVSHSSSSPNKTKAKDTGTGLDPSLKNYMKGFDDKDLDEMFGE